MRANLVIAVLLGVAVAGSACSDATGPKSVQHVATILDIKVPDRAAVGDTVKVVFSYAASFCDTGTVLQVRNTSEGARFTVTSWSTNQTCPAYMLSIIVLPSAGYIVNPPHPAPLRLIFSEPGGKDSVRLVGQ
jgi:hypothetical protein